MLQAVSAIAAVGTKMAHKKRPKKKVCFIDDSFHVLAAMWPRSGRAGS
jgi:hypothetical protein